ncbi:hypothetical protein ACLVWU_01105 [Bdellovibrio sp. HCB290]|uniref:hypothetical protein n=1 Tax=Bdellovibrio sp. HCB290 TaxID=3394356 RepID=UPI0039B4E707
MKTVSIFFVLLILKIASANAAPCDQVANTLPQNSELSNIFQCEPEQEGQKPVCLAISKIGDNQYLYQTIQDSVVINSATTKTIQLVGLSAKYSTTNDNHRITTIYWPNASLLILDYSARKGFFKGYEIQDSYSFTCSQK